MNGFFVNLVDFVVGFFRKTQTLGERGEDLAVRALRRAGYQILERNVIYGRNEIDILAREGDTVAFIEVKTRRETGTFQPEDNVTPDKERRIIRAADYYLAKHQDPETYYRFDVVTVVLPDEGKPEVTIWRDAFRG